MDPIPGPTRRNPSPRCAGVVLASAVLASQKKLRLLAVMLPVCPIVAAKWRWAYRRLHTQPCPRPLPSALSAPLQRAAAAAGGGEHGGAGSCGGEELIAQLQPPEGPWRLDCSVAVQLDPPGGRLLLRLPRELPSVSAAGAGGAGGEPGPAAEAADDDASGGSGAGAGDRSAEASGGGGGGFAVRYLPPINLQLRLHPAYPSAKPPQLLSLSALWLSPAQAGALAGHLQQLWEEQGPGLPVCFTWADWLQSSALGALGAAEVLTLERRGGGGGASTSSRGGSGGEGGDGSSWPEDAAGAAEAAGSREGGGGSSSGSDEDGGEEEEGGGFGQQGEGPDQVLFKLLRWAVLWVAMWALGTTRKRCAGEGWLGERDVPGKGWLGERKVPRGSCAMWHTTSCCTCIVGSPTCLHPPTHSLTGQAQPAKCTRKAIGACNAHLQQTPVPT